MQWNNYAGKRQAEKRTMLWVDPFSDYFPFGSHSSMRVPSGSVTQVKRP
ncbi:MAG: hypothetical protein JWR26_4561 [Pedosphaera sp.]|nr:hypothetical protein [Pedosphaera sp.]